MQIRNYQRIYRQKVRDMERRTCDDISEALFDAKHLNIPLQNYLTISREVQERQEHGLKVDRERVRRMKIEKEMANDILKKIKADKNHLKEVIAEAERAGLRDVVAVLKKGRV